MPQDLRRGASELKLRNSDKCLGFRARGVLGSGFWVSGSASGLGLRFL